jgi:hypothetical protein
LFLGYVSFVEQQNIQEWRNLKTPPEGAGEDNARGGVLQAILFDGYY